jgi:hypothetical protein
MCPVVTAIYAVTNLFVRLLGYDVRPFPGGWLGKHLYRFQRRLVRVAVKRGILRRGQQGKRSKEQVQQEERVKQEAKL